MYIYLDQNVMITLAGAMNGSERCKQYEGLAHRVMELSDADKVRFPASITHVIETQKLAPKRREPVREFIAKLSKQTLIAPAYRKEGEQVLNYLLRRPKKSVRDHVVVHPSHSSIQLTQDELSMRKRILFYLYEKSVPGVYSGVNDASVTGFMENANEYSEGYLSEFNERKEQQGLPSLREALLTTKLNGVISQAWYVHDIATRKRLKRVAGRRDPEELLMQAPSMHAQFLLEYERLKSGALQRNDYFDILALSTAMPYCDAVVFEKTFTNIARAAKVPGKIFSTAKNMREFEEFLE